MAEPSPLVFATTVLLETPALILEDAALVELSVFVTVELDELDGSSSLVMVEFLAV